MVKFLRYVLVIILIAPIVSYADNGEFDQLLKDLGAESYQVREEATKKIKERTPFALSELHALIDAANNSTDLEVKMRAGQLVPLKIPFVAPTLDSIIQEVRIKTGEQIPFVMHYIDPETGEPVELLMGNYDFQFDNIFAYRDNEGPTEKVLEGLKARADKIREALSLLNVTQAKQELTQLKTFLEGTTEKDWGNFWTHIIDPVTGHPVTVAVKKEDIIAQISSLVDTSIPIAEKEVTDNVPADQQPVRPAKVEIGEPGAFDFGANPTLTLSITGVETPGDLTLLGVSLENAVLQLPPSLASVGEIEAFRLIPDDDLLVSGQVTLGIAFDSFLDAALLDDLLIARTDGLDPDYLRPWIDRINHIAFVSYPVSASDQRQFGEFMLLRTVAEPSTLVLLCLGLLAAHHSRRPHFFR